MIRARYDEHGNIILDLKLIGRCGNKTVKTLLDTGFTGSLAIPVSVGCEIGLEPVGEAKVIVASGEAIPVPLFLGRIVIGEDEIDSIYIVLSGLEEVLIGMGVIRDYNVEFHGAKRTITIKKAEAIEKAEVIEETLIEPSVIASLISPSAAPSVEVTAAATEPILKAEEESDRMQALKETLREVVPR